VKSSESSLNKDHARRDRGRQSRKSDVVDAEYKVVDED